MLRNDVRYALRLMRRSPGFTAVAVLSLALGIGANTAIYSLFYTVMLRQLPVAHPEQLVEFLRTSPGDIRNDGYWGWDKYEYFRDHNHSLAVLTGMSFDNLASIRADQSDPETFVLENVLGNYFSVLGLKPAIGRLLGPDDVAASGDGDVVVVSWSYWSTRLRRDPAVVGKRIWYKDAPKTIVGVAPRGYTGPRVGVRTDVWMPCERRDLHLLGRLKPGVPIEQAQAELAVLYRSWLEQAGDPLAARILFELEPAATGLVRVRDRYGKALAILLTVVGALLLLACINMAGLLLARAAANSSGKC